MLIEWYQKFQSSQFKNITYSRSKSLILYSDLEDITIGNLVVKFKKKSKYEA